MSGPKDCQRCEALVKCRKTVVQGWAAGEHPRYALIGQNPGADEDAQGRPFVGRSGKVLASLVRAAGIDVEDIFLDNAVSCLTAANRKPKKEEYLNCREFLIDKLREISPSVIIALGEVATHSLYGRTSLDSVLGQTLIQQDLGIPLLASYHPAFILRGKWNAIPLVVSHLEKAKRIVEGTQKLGELGEYTTITTIKALRALKDYLLGAELLAVDTETTGLDWKRDELLCLSFSSEAGEGFTVPLMHGVEGVPEPFWSSQKEEAQAVKLIGDILASPVPKILQNGGFDTRFIERRHDSGYISAHTSFGWKIHNYREDTMLMHRLTAEYLPKETKPNELPHLLTLWSDMPPYEEEVRKQSKGKTRMVDVEDAVLRHYAAADVDALQRLKPILSEQLDADGGSRWIYKNISIPMVACCQAMTERGMLVDRPYFDGLISYYDKRHQDLMDQVTEIAGKEFNPNSNLQLQDILFNVLKLPRSGRKTDASRECKDCEAGDCSKHDQVSEDALLDIKGLQDHPIIDVLVLLRQVMKLRSTYLAGTKDEPGGFLQHICADNRIHAEFKSGGAATGRLSSSAPNGQNIPTGIEIEELHTFDAFHRTFIAPPGHILMAPDWSQAEVFVLMEESGDTTLREILESGRDVHTVVARHIFPIDLELDEYEWHKEHEDLRRQAKVFTFGISYGLTIPGIMERLHCSEEEAKSLLDAYLNLMPSLRDYFDRVRSVVMDGGTLVNRFGRRKHFPQVPVMRQCGASRDLEELFREAVNFPIQSGASDLHSLAHIATEQSPEMSKCFSIINAVHDSCLAEVPSPNTKTVLETAWKVKHLWQEIALNTVLADGTQLGWQIPTEIKWGRNWGDMPYLLTASGGLLYRGEPVNVENIHALPVA